MTMRRKNIALRRTLVAALLSCTALSNPAIAGFDVGTLDMASLAKEKESVQAAINQLKELTEMKKLAEEQLATIGEFGSLGNLFDGSAFSSIGSESDFYTSMEQFAFDPCAITLCQVGDNPVGTTDLEEAREWAMKSFFAGEPLTDKQEADLDEVRRRGIVYTTTNGVALANIIHNDLAGAGEQADALEGIVEASESLRGDVRANSAIALAAYKIEVQQLALLTAMLSVESMAALDQTTIYHEDGGSEFPDALLEDDFANNDRFTRTAVTAPTQGSASGSGFGGALIQSITGGDSAASDAISAITGGASGYQTPGELAGAMASGAIPTLKSENLNLSALTSDAVALTAQALDGKVPDAIASSLSQIQSGLNSDSSTGQAKAMLGIAQAISASSGNQALSSTLNTASIALSSKDTSRAIAFAKGVITELGKSTGNTDVSSFIVSQIGKAENGQISSEQLILDAAGAYAQNGRYGDATAATVLSQDMATMDDISLRDRIADTIELIGVATGDETTQRIAADLRDVDEEQIEALRDALARGEQDAAAQSSAANADASVQQVFQ